MPIEEMAKDIDFYKKYMLGLAMMIKKGLHIHFIHDTSRPFNEMMVGLEGFIPLYMTGQISPYYLKNSQSEIFHHLIRLNHRIRLILYQNWKYSQPTDDLGSNGKTIPK